MPLNSRSDVREWEDEPPRRDDDPHSELKLLIGLEDSPRLCCCYSLNTSSLVLVFPVLLWCLWWWWWWCLCYFLAWWWWWCLWWWSLKAEPVVSAMSSPTREDSNSCALMSVLHDVWLFISGCTNTSRSSLLRLMSLLLVSLGPKTFSLSEQWLFWPLCKLWLITPSSYWKYPPRYTNSGCFYDRFYLTRLG